MVEKPEKYVRSSYSMYIDEKQDEKENKLLNLCNDDFLVALSGGEFS